MVRRNIDVAARYHEPVNSMKIRQIA